jgi:hypothetical protein
MKIVVWVVECGVYSERGIEGVYGTIEEAIAASPISDYDRARWPAAHWQQVGPLAWENGCDGSSLVCATGYEVDVDTAVR